MCCLQEVRWNRHGARDDGKEIKAVVVSKRRWNWWCGRYGEGRAV